MTIKVFIMRDIITIYNLKSIFHYHIDCSFNVQSQLLLAHDTNYIMVCTVYFYVVDITGIWYIIDFKLFLNLFW